MKNGVSGLTLVELVLALTMLSILLLGTTTLDSAVTRLSLRNAEAVRMQNHTAYFYQLLEKDLSSAAVLQILNMPDPTATLTASSHYYRWRIKPLNANPDGSQDIVYEIDLRTSGSEVFRRTVGATAENLAPVGCLQIGPLKYPAPPGNRVAMWTSSDFKLMTVNLGLQSILPNKDLVGMSGYGKSFLMRTASVSDCRVQICV